MLRRILLVLLTALLGVTGWAWTAGSAYAGGPTSVLMTIPASGRAGALHVANPDYDRLYAAVGTEATGDPAPPSGLRSGGEEVRLTWLIHDMRVWRIDRVHLTGQDGIWSRRLWSRTAPETCLPGPPAGIDRRTSGPSSCSWRGPDF
jgi:hypothetical protein